MPNQRVERLLELEGISPVWVERWERGENYALMARICPRISLAVWSGVDFEEGLGWFETHFPRLFGDDRHHHFIDIGQMAKANSTMASTYIGALAKGRSHFEGVHCHYTSDNMFNRMVVSATNVTTRGLVQVYTLESDFDDAFGSVTKACC